MSSKTAKTIPLTVVLGTIILVLIDGIQVIDIKIDFTPMYYLIAVALPSSAAFGIFTKVFKRN